MFQKHVTRGTIPCYGFARRGKEDTSDPHRFRLDDQVAVVTGAGRGLGAAMALAFAEAGADVVIASRTQTELKEVAEQIRGMGRRAEMSSPTSPIPMTRLSSLARPSRSSAD